MFGIGSRYHPWLLALLGGSLLAVFFLDWHLPRNPILNQAQNLFHLPTFALLFFVLRWSLGAFRQRGLNLLLGAFLLAVGAGIELVQPLFGRSRSVEDLLLDAAGIAVGYIVWRVYSGSLRRFWLAAAAVICLGSLVHPAYWLYALEERRQQFPLLLDFDQRALTGFAVVVSGAELEAEQAPEGWQSNRSDVGLLRVPGGDWPGFYLVPPVRDWSRYAYLELDVYSENPQPVRLAVRVDDLAYAGSGDNFDRAYSIPPGETQLRIDLEHVRQAPRGRELDLRKIRQLYIYVRRPDKPVTLYLDNLRLTTE